MQSDADMVLFEDKLRYTPEGRDFTAAQRAMAACTVNIRTARTKTERRIWQVQYIRASDRATVALSVMRRKYCWPP